MKQIRWITLLLLLALFLAACGGGTDETESADNSNTTADATADTTDTTEASADEGSIWVLLPDSASSARWETDDRRFFEQAFEAAGVEYNIVNAEGDARTQQTQAEQAITAGAKVILIVNLDSGSAAAIIANAREADVKVVDYDRLTVEGPGADVYVSFDNVQVGQTMGEVLEPLINAQDGTPNVALLNGGPTDNNATLFREGYLNIAQPHFDDGSWNMVDDQWVPEWDNQQALVIFEQMLTAANDEISAVFAANDGLANAVISAYKNAGISPAEAGFPISGQDATVGGIQNILAGDQAMTVYKPIKAEAEAAANAAIALLRGEDLSGMTGGLTLNNGTNDIPFLALTPIGVTKDNIAETVIADGFRTWEEICVGDFAQYCPDASGAATIEDASDVEGSIWVLLPDSASSARWETDDRRFFEEAFEAAGVEYNIVNAEGDARTQQTQAEQAITAGAKVILIVNLDSGSAAAIIANARDAGVLVVDYDRLTVEGPGADVYVSFDNVQVGQTMGEVLEPLIDAQDGTPNVALLNGGPTDNNASLFREGYLNIAQPHFDDGSWVLVDDQWVPEWDNQQALVIFEQMLTAASDEISAVFAANDGLANAVISAFKNAGTSPAEAGIPISGQDATVGGIQNILAGDQAMTVYKPIRAEAFAAAQAAIALLRGEDLTALTGGLTLNNGTNDIPFLALTPIGVTKDNVAETVIADGFRTWDEICVGDFEQYCPADR
jgi:D-xylose transport system substrate-binding protein